MRGAARRAITAAATVAALFGGATAVAQPVGGQGGYAQRYVALCATCHGANGRSDQPGVPVLAGQHSFYAITQLFLFREGRRADPSMTLVAKNMTDDDLRGFSDYIGTLPPVPLTPPATPPDAARMARGRALTQQYRCVICHGEDFSGGKQVARIAQQKEEYLRMTLHEFGAGKRPGYTMAMIEALNKISPEDLDTMAYYIARLPGK
jgi:cytochrome c553